MSFIELRSPLHCGAHCRSFSWPFWSGTDVTRPQLVHRTRDKTGTAFSLKGKLLHEERTPYQQIAIWDTTTFGKLMTIDGCTMVSTRDNFLYHEMMSHPALNSHPNPRNVVVVGGGDCGTLREVLKHKGVKRCTQVEIDER